MRLWKLEPRIISCDIWGNPEPAPPWDHFGVVNGMVVRAETEEAARAIAQSHEEEQMYAEEGDGNLWENPSLTVCTPLEQAGAPGLVMRDQSSY